ncbi:MAG TPA: hypothetical protein VKR54_01465 [Candidatus Babeliales bacterium]|jgi:diadenosine tetraphosphate (Ap4A) HIT family hydrolase|nr:hypothetical protein [Candidatus Babeliales bacterium]
MLKRYIMMVGLCSAAAYAMNEKSTQMELCGVLRKEYVQKNIVNKPTTPVCPFCDEQILSTNYIVSEDHDKDVRIMMNKSPYFAFDQGHHLLIMPESHKELPGELSQEELAGQVDAAQGLSEQLYNDAYTQEYFTNWGRIAGQSVPHWHSQFKNYVEPTRSLPEQVQARKDDVINNVQDAYALLRLKLKSAQNVSIPSEAVPYDVTECRCCTINKNNADDEKNLVIGRFKHNYVCLSHYPSTAGELSVVPNQHVSTIKDLSQEALRENMILAMALLPTMKEYAQQNIRECGGGNLYTKSMGGKASLDEKSKYHVHTVIIPRTTIQPTPGSIDGNSCKLDVDPLHLFDYLRSRVDDLTKKTT